MDLKAASMIQLCLADEMVYNVIDKENGYKTMVKIRDIVYDKKRLKQAVS